MVWATGKLFLAAIFGNWANKSRSYFMAYEYLVQRHIRVNGVKREDISPLWAVSYGAAAGYALWAR